MATGWNRVGLLSVGRVRRSSQKGRKITAAADAPSSPPHRHGEGRGGWQGEVERSSLVGEGGERQAGGGGKRGSQQCSWRAAAVTVAPVRVTGREARTAPQRPPPPTRAPCIGRPPRP